MTGGRGLFAILVAAILGLAGVIAAEVTVGSAVAPVEAAGRVAAAPAPAIGDPAAGERQRAVRVTEVLARPLFSPNRRPLASVGKTQNGLSRLTGVVITDGRKLAIFAPASGGRPVVAEEGSHLGVYEIRTITGQGVTVAGPEGVLMIRPVFDPAEPKPAPPARPEPPRVPGK